MSHQVSYVELFHYKYETVLALTTGGDEQRKKLVSLVQAATIKFIVTADSLDSPVNFDTLLAAVDFYNEL